MSRELPANLDAEQCVLGAMLLNADAIADALETCSADDFHSPKHRLIFAAMVSLYSRGEPVSVTTVLEHLDRDDRWLNNREPAYLNTLQIQAPSRSTAGHYGRMVRKCSLLRQLIEVGSEITELGFMPTDDVDSVLDRAETMLFAVADRRASKGLRHISELLAETIDVVEQRFNGVSLGVPTGYLDLDQHLLGLQPSNLVVIAARPSMGKSALALGIAAQAQERTKLPVAVFSFEMSDDELTERMISSDASIDSVTLRSGRLSDGEWTRFATSVGRLRDAYLYVDDDPTTTVMGMRAKARRLKAQHGLSLVIVDYMQLMETHAKRENRQAEVAEISRGLKIMARELNVPVVAMAQLSRALELRSDKRPMLSDLRESGAIEQDADVVLFIYRDEVYYPTSPDAGLAEIIVAKHRNGPTGTVKLAWLPKYTRFANRARMTSDRA